MKSTDDLVEEYLSKANPSLPMKGSDDENDGPSEDAGAELAGPGDEAAKAKGGEITKLPPPSVHESSANLHAALSKISHLGEKGFRSLHPGTQKELLDAGMIDASGYLTAQGHQEVSQYFAQHASNPKLGPEAQQHAATRQQAHAEAAGQGEGAHEHWKQKQVEMKGGQPQPGAQPGMQPGMPPKPPMAGPEQAPGAQLEGNKPPMPPQPGMPPQGAPNAAQMQGAMGKPGMPGAKPPMGHGAPVSASAPNQAPENVPPNEGAPTARGMVGKPPMQPGKPAQGVAPPHEPQLAKPGMPAQAMPPAGQPGVPPKKPVPPQFQKSMSGLAELGDYLEKAGGPFIGPRGGKWADAKHTVSWKDAVAQEQAAKPKQGESLTYRKGITGEVANVNEHLTINKLYPDLYMVNVAQEDGKFKTLSAHTEPEAIRMGMDAQREPGAKKPSGKGTGTTNHAQAVQDHGISAYNAHEDWKRLTLGGKKRNDPEVLAAASKAQYHSAMQDYHLGMKFANETDDPKEKAAHKEFATKRQMEANRHEKEMGVTEDRLQTEKRHAEMAAKQEKPTGEKPESVNVASKAKTKGYKSHVDGFGTLVVEPFSGQSGVECAKDLGVRLLSRKESRENTKPVICEIDLGSGITAECVEKETPKKLKPTGEKKAPSKEISTELLHGTHGPLKDLMHKQTYLQAHQAAVRSGQDFASAVHAGKGVGGIGQTLQEKHQRHLDKLKGIAGKYGHDVRRAAMEGVAGEVNKYREGLKAGSKPKATESSHPMDQHIQSGHEAAGEAERLGFSGKDDKAKLRAHEKASEHYESAARMASADESGQWHRAAEQHRELANRMREKSGKEKAPEGGKERITLSGKEGKDTTGDIEYHPDDKLWHGYVDPHHGDQQTYLGNAQTKEEVKQLFENAHKHREAQQKGKGWLNQQGKTAIEEHGKPAKPVQGDLFAKKSMSGISELGDYLRKSAEQIPGGLSSGKSPSDFDPKALAQGTKVEMEHTTSKKTAQEIAQDHLTEDPHYYTKLAKMEKCVMQKSGLGELGDYLNKADGMPDKGDWDDIDKPTETTLGGSANGGDLTETPTPEGAGKSGAGEGQDAKGQLTGVSQGGQEILGDDRDPAKQMTPGTSAIEDEIPEGYKSLTPASQREMVAKQTAQHIAKLQKSNDVRVGAPHPLSMASIHGNTDAECEALLKSDFYHGASPTLALPGSVLRKNVLCKSENCGCRYSAMLTACPGCGEGTVTNRMLPRSAYMGGGSAIQLEKSACDPILKPAPVEDDVCITGPSPVVFRKR